MRLPLSVTYRFLRWFHGRAEAVMVPTEVVRRDLLAYGFAPEKVVLWSRGVDLDIFKPGPALASLKARFPGVRFAGVMSQSELAALYNAADVFVFPSRTDTFRLVLLEALACGCPVAAYPVTGPVDVIGDSPAGALDEDLRAAALRALKIDRSVARTHAERFSWEACTRQFLSHLHPFDDGHRAGAVGDAAT